MNVLVLKDKNFLIYLFGTAISIFGDAISMIALPWYVLKLTGEPSMLGIILTLEALPRAAFMLFGGAVADKISPRKLLLFTRFFSIFLIGSLGFLILFSLLQIWMIYILAVIVGTVGAFHIPAATAIVPTLVKSENLRPANAAVTGLAQLSMIIGPALAGILIAFTSSDGVSGIGYAFLIDACTFIIGAFTLFFVKTRITIEQKEHDSLLKSLKKGLAYAYHTTVLRILLIYIALVNLLVMGVLLVGLPVFAESDLGLGVKGYGWLMGALGAGSLIGTIMTGILPPPPEKNRGIFLFMGSSLAGLALALAPNINSSYGSIAIIGFAGLMSGYTNIFFITWIQQFVDVKMIGRIMSIITFASVAFIPLSTFFSGFAIEIFGVKAAMATGGILFSLSALSCMVVPELRKLETPKKKESITPISNENQDAVS